MKATKLTIGFREWSKLPDFVEMINEEDEMVAYEIDNTIALLGTDLPPGLRQGPQNPLRGSA